MLPELVYCMLHQYMCVVLNVQDISAVLMSETPHVVLVDTFFIVHA